MVGSKYHDFIQSADKISAMKDKSLQIENQITTFWKHNQELIGKAQTLVNFTQPESKKFQPLNHIVPLEGKQRPLFDFYYTYRTTSVELDFLLISWCPTFVVLKFELLILTKILTVQPSGTNSTTAMF